jgi:DNA-binding response OmpR family regulator
MVQEESPVRVLLIEDNVDASEIMAIMLDNAGFHTTPVRTLAAAAMEYRRARPDVIVSDLSLPDDRGGGIATLVRGCHDFTTHLIALSGRDDGQRVADAVGFDLFLLKPVKVIQLVEAIRRGVERPSSTPFR